MIRVGSVLLAGALVLAAVGGASAHSLLLESSPAAGSVLPAPPPRLTLGFNNRIEKPLCRVRLVNDRGQARALEVLTAAGPADRLTASLPSLAPGEYRIEWQVLSTDGHVVSGRFSFRIAPAERGR